MRPWVFVTMAVLAALDLAGAMLAKELAARPRAWLYAVAIVVWVVLFVVYVRSVGVSDLWLVTVGWITLLQVGVVLVDRFHYGVAISPRKWVLVAVLVVVQLALLLPDGHDDAEAHPDRPPNSGVEAVPRG